MKKITLLLLIVAAALLSNAQTASTANTLAATGITAINSTTNAAFKLSINGTQKNYGTGDGTGLAASMVISPTIFLQNLTATTGKMYPINSNNTGFFRISDAVGTATFTATDRFVISPAGFIGMGNSAPTARLHITSSGITSATNALLVNNSTNTNLFAVRDDGNVGIGVAAPAQKLDVAGNINFTGALMANNNAGTAGFILKSSGAGVAPTWALPDAATNTAWGISGNSNATAASFLGTTANFDLVLKANNVEAMRMAAIDGAATFNSTGNSLAVFNSPNVSGSWLRVNSNSTNIQTGFGFRFSVNNTVKSQIFFNEGAFSLGTAIDGLVGNTEVLSRLGDVLLSTNSFRTNSLILKNTTGYLGIGTLTPNNKVEITHGTAGNSGLRFTNLTSASAAAVSSGKVLSVNTNGDVVLETAGVVTVPDGSETKINAGANITVAGTGTTASPYVIAATLPVNTAWDLSGNANATAASFLGTPAGTDIDLVFKRNGIQAGRIDATKTNTSFGLYSHQAITTGSGNTALGHTSSYSLTTGAANTSIGYVSLRDNTTGVWNTALGHGTKLKCSTGSYNTALGGAADGYNTTGSYNTVVGAWTLFNNLTGSFNTSLGWRTNTGSTDLENTTTIGAYSYVTQSNSLILGSIAGINSAPASTNVGIGTTAPTAQLHTTGTVKFAGLVANTTAARVVVSDADGNIAYKDAATFGSNADGSETKINAGVNVTVSGTGTTASPYIVSATVPAIPAALWTASSIGANNITNANTGAVVIGSTITNLPNGYKLYVADGILAEKVKVALKSGINWADYVFAKNYKLMPLSEVEVFVNKNKHLPGVQSTEELIKDGGIDVNQMFAKQMEKIEELTLHLIEINKKLEKLEKENNSLKAKVSNITNP
jgi:trimeric autotransporter adhesin